MIAIGDKEQPSRLSMKLILIFHQYIIMEYQIESNSSYQQFQSQLYLNKQNKTQNINPNILFNITT